MPSDSPHFRPGDFCRVDLNARDPDAARVFYAGLFGWTGEFAGRAGEAGPYERFFLDGLLVAGMRRMSDEMRGGGSPSAWVSYIRVDDAGAVLKAAEALGARVTVPATTISEAGRIAFIEDPTGASVAFWEAGLEPGAEATKAPGTFCWNELATPDLGRAYAFYAELLGWTGYINFAISVRNRLTCSECEHAPRKLMQKMGSFNTSLRHQNWEYDWQCGRSMN